MVVLHLVKTSVGAMWALRLMRELVAQGIEVHVALPCGGPCEALYREAGITTHDIDFSLRRCAASVRPCGSWWTGSVPTSSTATSS